MVFGARYSSKTMVVALLGLLAIGHAHATPGEYSMHGRIGPTFPIQDHDTNFKIGGEFDYQLGYGFGFNLSNYYGFGETTLIQFIPAVKYDIVYFVPGTLYAIAGAGWELFDGSDSALGLRFGAGLRLPLRKPWEFISDVNFFISTVGADGTPVTFDWLTGIGVRY